MSLRVACGTRRKVARLRPVIIYHGVEGGLRFTRKLQGRRRRAGGREARQRVRTYKRHSGEVRRSRKREENQVTKSITGTADADECETRRSTPDGSRLLTDAADRRQAESSGHDHLAGCRSSEKRDGGGRGTVGGGICTPVHAAVIGRVRAVQRSPRIPSIYRTCTRACATRSQRFFHEFESSILRIDSDYRKKKNLYPRSFRHISHLPLSL